MKKPKTVSDTIALYWRAIEAWRVADRRRKRLAKRLSDDVMRWPRAVIGYKVGNGSRTPMYAGSEYEIQSFIEAEKRAVAWSVRGDPKRRRKFNASYHAKAQRMIAELEADRDALHERQRTCGWKQATEAWSDAEQAVYSARHEITKAKPASSADTWALLTFVREATALDNRSPGGRAPYGLSSYYLMKILRNASTPLENLPSRLKIAA